MSTILKVEQLQLSIAGKRICTGLDWKIEPQQIWGVLGVNGIGKSTLLQALCGLQPIEHGEISLQQQPLQQLKRRDIARAVALLFQHQDDIFPATVLEQVMMGRHPHTTLLKGEQPEDFKIAEQVIVAMGLSGMELRTVDTLSGGERRRVALATILAQQPRLYLLDEPEAHLDPKHQKVIFNKVVEQARTQQAALVMALHDINLAIHHCTHLLMLLKGGEAVQGEVKEMVSQQQIEQLYGTEMVRIEQNGQIAYLAL
ncbi:MAG: ABC transporter ATP-binding protein [Gammaproteobacteria bacterium]|jgi:iron complex transport system ATP-binding protein|nr:ABC transporter ATP-binding protein [Gammaproteobacteria bacterium]MBT5372615.1 ABC transporter ATP-binding protein [Gammaproteobacteria bacterium]MBT6479068.1 ABC transporter ATP-binding protein [Gammaproteobacteria bacterium]MBT6651409.1 ABC transporter ATP-binding protein [Gammaproteobacteria bacterium]MBT6880725.1 ABC transporter ATP-binding protein [Gammaproteobacteria bacterium]